MKKRARSILAFFLTTAMVMGLIGTPVYAEDFVSEAEFDAVLEAGELMVEAEESEVSKSEEQSSQEQAVLEQSGEDSDFLSEEDVDFFDEAEMDPALVSTLSGAAGEVSRGEWLHSLITVFELSVDENDMPDAYFPDLQKTDAYYNDVMIAAEFGLVGLEAGQEVRAEDAATRGFASHTLNMLLGYEPNSSNYAFQDADDCADADSAQVAVERGWFALINGMFMANEPITGAEASGMLNDATQNHSALEVPESYDSQFVFADYVVVTSKVATVRISEDKVVTIIGSSKKVAQGDTFVVWPNMIPAIYVAENVTTTGNTQVITTSEADVDSAIVSVNAAGSVDVDLENFEGADGFKTNYIETQAEIDSVAEVYGIRVERGSVIADKTFKLDNGLKVSFACNISNLNLKYASPSKKESTVYVTGNYTITSTASLDVIAALNGSKSITIGSISVAGVGRVTLSLDLTMDGKASVTYSGNFMVGVRNDNGSKSLIHNFQKTGFNCDIEANASIAVKVDFAIDIFIAKGDVWASAGLASKFTYHSYNDGALPNACSNLKGWLFAKAGANAKIGLGSFTIGEPFSKTIDIYTASNSPVQISFHWEDGKRVYSCGRGNTSYFTFADSSLGSSSYGGGSSSGIGSNGEPYTIYNYSLNSENQATITSYYGNAAMVNIPSTLDGYTVVAIGSKAFENQSAIRSVVIPDTVTLIKEFAFRRCENLSTVILSENVSKIEGLAFAYCNALTEIELPKSLVETTESLIDLSWKYGVFYGCENLRKVTIEEGSTVIANRVLANCPGLEEVVIPNSVTTIKAYAFYNCPGLEKIIIPNSVTTINDYAFGNCSKLSNLVLSKNVTKIGGRAFVDCDALTEIELPKSLVETTESLKVTTWEYGVFYGCDNLKKVTIEEGSTVIANGVMANCPGLEEVVIPNSVTTIKECAFYNCEKLSKLTLPKNITKIEGRAFAYCNALTEIDIPKSLVSTTTSWTGSRYVYGVFYGCENLKKVTIEEGSTVIANGVMANCPGIEEIIIPDSITTIGNSAFYQCENLKQVTWGTLITKIGDDAFGGQNSLETIVIPESVTTIGESAFENNPALKTIVIPNSVTSLGARAFRNCDALTEIKLPDSISVIENGTFYDCDALVEITIPDSVTQIRDYVFEECDSLKKINFGKNVTGLGAGLFRSCKVLAEIEIPNSVTSLGANIFYNCDSLIKIAIADSVTSIGNYAFYDCDALKNVSLGSGLTSIQESCFEHCDALEEIYLPRKVQSIGNTAFKNDIHLTSIFIPKATTSISATAFSYPDRMTIYGLSDTYAETFAKENGFAFVAKPVPATEVSLSETNLTLNKGQSHTVLMTVTPADFTDDVSWKSTDTNVATVTADGVVKAVNTGTATIKLTVGDVSASCKVTVIQPVTGISLNKSSLSLEALGTYQLTANVNPSNAANKAITWSSADETIASVDQNGLVTALRKGSVVITAAAMDGSGVKANCTVTVTNTAHIASSVAEMESPHNYTSNCSDFWVYTLPGATKLNVTFDSRTNIEEDFDFLYIYNGAGNQIGKYTGTELAGKVLNIEGDTIRVKLVSDGSGNTWGFKITDISDPENFRILKQPEDKTAEIGKTVVFSVEAAGNGLTYQWQYKNAASTTWANSGMTGNKTPELTVEAIAKRNGQSYRCVITDESGKTLTSDAAVFTVKEAFAIISQPVSVETAEGSKVSFQVKATGSGLIYQWQYKTPTATSWKNSSLSGYATDTLKVTATEARNGQKYRCRIKDENGNTLYSKAAELIIQSGPEILSQPQSVEATAGEKVTFAVEAIGNNLTYQWQYKNATGTSWANSSMVGAKTASITVEATEKRNGQQYRCVVKDSTGKSLTSDAAVLSVITKFEITRQPVSQSGAIGDTVFFETTATGSGVVYQWQYQSVGTTTWKNSSLVSAKTSTLKVGVTEARDGQKYRCKITDSTGKILYTSAVTLNLKVLLQITKQPSSKIVSVGEIAEFKVEAAGKNLTYQWQYRKDSSAAWANSGSTGARTAVLKIEGKTTRHGQQYHCIITDADGNSVTTKTVTLYIEE